MSLGHLTHIQVLQTTLRFLTCHTKSGMCVCILYQVFAIARRPQLVRIMRGRRGPFVPRLLELPHHPPEEGKDAAAEEDGEDAHHQQADGGRLYTCVYIYIYIYI